MKYCLLFVLLGVAVSAEAQCANTSYGGGFTCVQQTNPVVTGGGSPVNLETITLAANSTPGHGIIAVGNYCTTSGCATSAGPIPNVNMTDGAGDTGWQPCSFNGASANGLRFWYCWWLPNVGSTTTFTIHANAAYGLMLWVAEFSGGCSNTIGCIDSVATPVSCAGGAPCGVPITTIDTNILVIGFGYLAGTSLTAASGWKNIGGCVGSGCAIGALASVPGVYAPTWTNTSATLQMLAVGIESPNSVQPAISVPTMPVY